MRDWDEKKDQGNFAGNHQRREEGAKSGDRRSDLFTQGTKGVCVCMAKLFVTGGSLFFVVRVGGH